MFARMRVGKWDFEKHIYKPYKIPKEWRIVITTDDMSTKVNCASCGKELTYGECYTSRQIQLRGSGLGLGVCSECYEKEWELEYAAKKVEKR